MSGLGLKRRMFSRNQKSKRKQRRMIQSPAYNFFPTEEQLQNSPSRKDGIDEATEINLRIYGCDLIQESAIHLKLPPAAAATGQVLLHRFYCMQSFARFNVKKVASACVWLAAKVEEEPRKATHVIVIFRRIECMRNNLPVVDLDPKSEKFVELKEELSRTEMEILRAIGFICLVRDPHQFIPKYLAILAEKQEAPHQEFMQEACNRLANDSLRTTLYVRFKTEVVACGVVCAAARMLRVPLPQNWCQVFDDERSGIDEVCRVLDHLHSLPKAKYVSVCKHGDFSFCGKSLDPQPQPIQNNFPHPIHQANNFAPWRAPIVANNCVCAQQPAPTMVNNCAPRAAPIVVNNCAPRAAPNVVNIFGPRTTSKDCTPRAAPTVVNIFGSRTTRNSRAPTVVSSATGKSRPARGEIREEEPRSKYEHRTYSTRDREWPRERDWDRDKDVEYEHRTYSTRDREWLRERYWDGDRDVDRDRIKARDSDRYRDFYGERERDEAEEYWDRSWERRHRSREREMYSRHSEKSRYHPSPDRDYRYYLYTSREKDPRRHYRSTQG